MHCCEDIESVAISREMIKDKVLKCRKGRSGRSKKIPDSLINDPYLLEATAALPSNYNFEIPKTIWKIRELVDEPLQHECHSVSGKIALQFPEGLLIYSCVIVDILEQFTQGFEFIVLGDVTYGACCIDDLTARALGCCMIVHYGHSCLVPLSTTCIKCLYIFVEISIDVDHLCECVKKTFSFGTTESVVLLGTIQFSGAVHEARSKLIDHIPSISVSQAKPLSPGEVLGCTSPVLQDSSVLIFIADGRFHLESAMIQNPNVKHFRYDPYAKVLSLEKYDTAKMQDIRMRAITEAKKASTFGVILGTLGRQGNPHILDRLIDILKKYEKQYFILLLSEIFPAKLEQISHIDAWIQVACPRLSIDWGHFFLKPLLSPYEAEVCLGETEWKEVYPMDFYAKDGGSWSNSVSQR